MARIKDQAPFLFNAPFSTCPGTQIQLACGNLLCAEIDEDGNPIYRERPSDIVDPTDTYQLNELVSFNPIIVSSGNKKQVGNVAPCQIELSIDGVANQPIDISPESEADRLNGTYKSVASISNPYDYPQRWRFDFYDGLQSVIGLYGDLYLYTKDSIYNYSHDELASGVYDEVYLRLNVYQGAFGTDPLCASFEKKVGDIEYKSIDFASKKVRFMGNSTARCTSWDNLQLDYVSDEVNGYYNILDFSNATVSITSINDKNNTLERFKEVKIQPISGGYDNLFRSSFVMDLKEDTLRNGEEITYRYAPTSLKATFNNIVSSGNYTDNRRCYDCEVLNGDHILRDSTYISINRTPVFSKRFAYQDDKNNPENPICDEREIVAGRGDPCFPSGTSIDEISVFYGEGFFDSTGGYIEVELFHTPMNSEFYRESLVKYRKKVTLVHVDTDIGTTNPIERYSIYPSYLGEIPVYQVSELGSGICDFSNSTVSLEPFMDEDKLILGIPDDKCYACSEQEIPSILFSINITSTGKDQSAARCAYHEDFCPNPDIHLNFLETNILQESVNLTYTKVYEEDGYYYRWCWYSYYDDRDCDDVELFDHWEITWVNNGKSYRTLCRVGAFLKSVDFNLYGGVATIQIVRVTQINRYEDGVLMDNTSSCVHIETCSEGGWSYHSGNIYFDISNAKRNLNDLEFFNCNKINTQAKDENAYIFFPYGNSCYFGVNFDFGYTPIEITMVAN